MSKNRFVSVIIPVILLFLMALAACAEASPSFGRYFRGRTLDLNVVSLERVPVLRYSLIDSEQVVRHYQIVPSSKELELALVRLKVENHTATSAIVNIDGRAAELRDFLRGTYRPINVNERVEEVSAPENPGTERRALCPQAGVPRHPRDICFLWNEILEDGDPKAFVLKKGFGLDGWLVFEAPKDSAFRELRWRAGDSLTIDF